MRSRNSSLISTIFALVFGGFAHGQSQAWYVDVQDSIPPHLGTAASPFQSLNALLGPGSSVTLAAGDQISVASGDYADTSTGTGLENWGYEIPAGLSIRYWDRYGILPQDPGFVRFLGSNRNFAFTIRDGLASFPIKIIGWVGGLTVADKQRFLFSGFANSAVFISPQANSWEDTSSVVVDGVKVEDCAKALDLFVWLVEKEINLAFKRSIIRCPSNSSTVLKNEPLVRLVENESGDNGSVKFLMESCDLRTVDVNHGTSAIAISTEDTRGGSIYELRGVFIGAPTGSGGPFFDGAGIEMLYRFQSEVTFSSRNLRVRDCLGNGILSEVRGDNVVASFQMDNSKIRNCGLVAPTKNPYWSPHYTSNAFNQSGVVIVANEDARWSQISLNGTECTINGRHGLNIRSNGAIEIPRSFPDIDAFKCNFSYNGQANIGNRLMEFTFRFRMMG